MILSSSYINDTEKTALISSNAILGLYYSGVTFDNMFITSEYTQIASSIFIFIPVFIQNYTLGIYNCHFQHQGLVYDSLYPSNLLVENVTLDMHRSSGGFQDVINCNFPEADLDSSMVFKNVKFYNSDNRPANVPMSISLIFYSGPGDFALDNVLFNTYSDFSDFALSLAIFSSFICNPMTDTPRYFNFTDVSMTTDVPDGMSSSDVFSTIFISFFGPQFEDVYMTFNNITIYDIADNDYRVLRVSHSSKFTH